MTLKRKHILIVFESFIFWSRANYWSGCKILWSIQRGIQFLLIETSYNTTLTKRLIFIYHYMYLFRYGIFRRISTNWYSLSRWYCEFGGFPRCKNLWSFSLFSSYYFPWLYCVDFSEASLYSLFYVTGFYIEDEPIFRCLQNFYCNRKYSWIAVIIYIVWVAINQTKVRGYF